MSEHNLSNNKISLLSKRFKFVPTLRSVNKVLTRKRPDTYGRKLRLLRYFLNDEKKLVWKDAAIVLYLSHFQKRISSLYYKVVYSNLTKGERDAIFSFKNEAGKEDLPQRVKTSTLW